MSVGIAERCVEIMVRHGPSVRPSARSINRFGQIQRYIAEGYAMTEAAKCFVYNTAREVNPNNRARVNSDAVKLFAAPVGKIGRRLGHAGDGWLRLLPRVPGGAPVA